MDLTFKALQEDFTGTWPAKLCIENDEYTAKLFYAGASADPSDDAGEYAADLAAGRLNRKNLSLVCKPKGRVRDVSLGIAQGHVVLSLPSMAPILMMDEARCIAEDLLATIDNAAALDEFIESWFGPTDD